MESARWRAGGGRRARARGSAANDRGFFTAYVTRQHAARVEKLDVKRICNDDSTYSYREQFHRSNAIDPIFMAESERKREGTDLRPQKRGSSV